MNRLLMQESKSLAFQTIKKNFFKILWIIFIACMPALFCNLSIFSLLPTIDVNTATIEQVVQSSMFELFAQLGMILVSIIFYPITVSAITQYLKLARGEQVHLHDLFVNYSSLKRVFRCFTLQMSTFFKMFARLFPVAIIGGVFTLIFSLVNYAGFGIIAIVPFYIGIFIIMFYGLGRAMPVLMFEKIAILNFEDQDFSRKETYKQLKTIYKGRTKELGNVASSFLGWWMVSMVLSSFTAGVSVFLYTAYFAIGITHYATKHNTQFLPKKNNFLGGE